MTTARGTESALAKRLAAEEKSLIAQFEGIIGDHRGERGRRGEEIVREFLRRYLPHRFGVGEGEVIGPSEEFSPQLDAIIFNWTGAAPLDRSPASQVYQLRDVYCGIEVRTNLRASDMAEIAGRCRKFNSLIPPGLWKPTTKVLTHKDRVIQREYNSLPFYGVIAHRGGDLVDLANAFEEACSPTKDVGTRFGFVYVMERGLFLFHDENKRVAVGPQHFRVARNLGIFPKETLETSSLYCLYRALLVELEDQAIERG